AQRELDALALAQELLRRLQLPLEVVRVGARADPQLLELRDVLLLLRLGVFLLLRVAELAVIEQAAHRRLRHGRNLHQVDFRFLRHPESFLGRNDAELLTGQADQAYLGYSYLTVGSMLLVGANGQESRTARSLHRTPFFCDAKHER